MVNTSHTITTNGLNIRLSNPETLTRNWWFPQSFKTDWKVSLVKIFYNGRDHQISAQIAGFGRYLSICKWLENFSNGSPPPSMNCCSDSSGAAIESVGDVQRQSTDSHQMALLCPKLDQKHAWKWKKGHKNLFKKQANKLPRLWILIGLNDSKYSQDQIIAVMNLWDWQFFNRSCVTYLISQSVSDNYQFSNTDLCVTDRRCSAALRFYTP